MVFRKRWKRQSDLILPAGLDLRLSSATARTKSTISLKGIGSALAVVFHGLLIGALIAYGAYTTNQILVKEGYGTGLQDGYKAGLYEGRLAGYTRGRTEACMIKPI